MTTTTNATVINGRLQLDEPLDLPEQSRVAVNVSVGEAVSRNDMTPEARRRAFEAFVALGDRLQLRVGEHLTRDQMHDRD